MGIHLLTSSCTRSRSQSPVSTNHSFSSRSHSKSGQSLSVASSREESQEGASRRPRWFRSLSRTSFRGGSACPGGLKRSSRSHSPTQSRRADEDHQEEQSSLDFVAVVASLHSLNGLSEAPSESYKICGFRAALEEDDQLAASYKLPIEDASVDIDDRVSSTSSGMLSREVSKLLQFLDVTSRRFYRFEGEDITKGKELNCYVTEVAGVDSGALTTLTRRTSSGPLQKLRRWRPPCVPLWRRPRGWTSGLM